jgi:hypothetical protein
MTIALAGTFKRAETGTAQSFVKTPSGRGAIPLFLALACLLAFGTTSLRAQTYLQGIGVPTFTTQVPVENGFINVANGNLHLEIPLGSFPQRGGGTDNVSLMYDSAIWLNNGTVWSPTNVSTYSNNSNYVFGGWRLVTSGDPGRFTYGATSYGDCYMNLYPMWTTYSPWVFVAPDGTVHSFPASTTAPASSWICPGTGTPSSSAYASDGTGYFISITNYTAAVVYAPDGTAVGTIKNDPNGNQYPNTFGCSPCELKLYDTLNRKIVDVTGSSGGPYTYAVSNDQGGTSSYTVKLTPVSVDTGFGQTGVTEYSGTIQAINEIDFPDGSSYQFTYDSGTTSGHYGLLTSMTLRTGGQVKYSWALQHDAGGLPFVWPSSRTTPDGTWNYGFSVLSTCTSGQVNCEQQATVTKPTNDQTVYMFALNGGAWPVQAQYYTGPASSANLRISTSQCFSFVSVTNGACSYTVTTAAPATSVHVVAATTILPTPTGNLNKTVGYTWDTGNHGTLTQLSEWTFGNSPANAADRTTKISYYSPSTNPYNVINRPGQITVTDKNNNTISQTNFTYDSP